MPTLIDMTGQRFGRLTVLRRATQTASGQAAWICLCDCGQQTQPIAGDNLRRGGTRSCGCLQTESRYTANLRHGHFRDGVKTPEYETWWGMIRRCEKPNHKFYRLYGGRGITVCPQWRESFQQFLADVGPRPGPEYSIDRIDNDGNYEPGNVRWATASEQNGNRRRMRPRTNSNSSTSGRVVHVEMPDGSVVVRYGSPTGAHWFREWSDDEPRDSLSCRAAAELAVTEGARCFLGLPGGKHFDRLVRSLAEGLGDE